MSSYKPKLLSHTLYNKFSVQNVYRNVVKCENTILENLKRLNKKIENCKNGSY